MRFSGEFQPKSTDATNVYNGIKSGCFELINFMHLKQWVILVTGIKVFGI